MRKYYKAEMDRLLRVLTNLVRIFFLLAPAGLCLAWYLDPRSPARCGSAPFSPRYIFAGIILLVAAATAVTAWLTRAMAPRGYIIDDLGLTVDRAIKPVHIPLAEIEEARRLEGAPLRRSLRLMGTAGYYGYYGLYWNRELGKFRAYATRLGDLVLVRTAKEKFVLSPDDIPDFLAALGSLKGWKN